MVQRLTAFSHDCFLQPLVVVTFHWQSESSINIGLTVPSNLDRLQCSRFPSIYLQKVTNGNRQSHRGDVSRVNCYCDRAISTLARLAISTSCVTATRNSSERSRFVNLTGWRDHGCDDGRRTPGIQQVPDLGQRGREFSSARQGSIDRQQAGTQNQWKGLRRDYRSSSRRPLDDPRGRRALARFSRRQ